MDVQTNRTQIDRLIWLVTVAFLSLICILTNDSFGSLALLGCAILIFILTAIQRKGIIRLEIGQFHRYWLVFGGYCLLTVAWAWVPAEAIRRGTTIMEVFACMVLMYVHYQDEQDIWHLYNAVRWSGVFVCLYTLFFYGAEVLVLLLSSGNRLEVDFANFNTIGILAAIAIIISLYEWFFRQKKLLSLLVCLPCLIIMAASGTRKALLAVVLGVALLLYFRYRSKEFLKTALKMLVIGAAALAALVAILSLPLFSGLMDRVANFFALVTGVGEADGSSIERSRFIQIGMEQFWKTPIFGIGIGNSGALLVKNFERDTYLHNNYVELLCCGGIVGFLLYYAMYGCCLRVFFRHHKDTDPLAKLGIVLIAVMLAMDFARVSYYSKPTLFYMMIFFLHIRQLKKQEKKTWA